MLILSPLIHYITLEELNEVNLKYSKVLICIIKKKDTIISEKKRYFSILKDLWSCMPVQKILQTTTFNMKLTNENGTDGYNWCSDLHLSIQGKPADYTLKEILNMINVNKFSIEISIKLQTNQIIKFSAKE